MLRCGLLGEKLSHSYSPQIHALLGDYSYELFEVKGENLQEFLTQGGFDGINVTIPYKQEVMPYLSEVSKTAQIIGSVNTVIRRKDGTLFGDNTDIYGFKYMLRRNRIDVLNKKALVLGSGGTSKTACFALKELGAAEITVISRGGKDNYENIQNHGDAQIVVNTTPVGMYPNNGKSAVDLSCFGCLEGVVDVIYNPNLTQLLLQAEELNVSHAGGLSMLVAQAKRSAELFMGKQISDDRIDEITKKLSIDMKNIILIGMPGSGKSSIGKLLAKKTDREFIDIDDYIVKKAEMSIPDIFSKEGEEGFRKRETDALKDICKLSGKVIATGGGCVTRKINYPLLHQNGIIVYVKRALDKLPLSGRPLSMSTPLTEMFRQRREKYEAFCDFAIDNDERIEDAACSILQELL